MGVPERCSCCSHPHQEPALQDRAGGKVLSPPLLCLILRDVSDTSEDLACHMGETNPTFNHVWGFLNQLNLIQGCQGLVMSEKVSHNL